MSLVVNNVGKTYRRGIWRYKEILALKDITFSLEQGKVLALLGQNGAGKTTLIKCLLNFLKVDTGTIRINGQNIETLINLCKVGYMPEKLQFSPKITIKEYISDLMILRGKNDTEYLNDLSELISEFYLEDHLQKKLETFSKGTAKKVAFIQAILHKPELLILDEPTDGLDPVSRRVLLNKINFLKRQGCTVVITTHLLSDISFVADQLIVLQKGQIIENVEAGKLNSSVDDWYLNVIMNHGGMNL